MARPKRTMPERTRNRAERIKTADTSNDSTVLASTRWGNVLERTFRTTGIVFFVLWILIGVFLALVIVQGLRRGAYTGLFGTAPSVATPSPETQTPTEAPLPGIGTVNIACVQQAIKPESLQKVIQAKSIDVLQGDEKTKFQACITKPETAGSPQASASSNP